ncbi:MAG TPA: MOSC domain-containing protein [Candidatus Acidoferrales bacterium]|nr:MOSC domain-containing protein [Candidatus Acidoferrales bacterium]
MKVVSVNVGRPRRFEQNGKEIVTGIFKAPVAGRVAVRTLNLEGDQQADLEVHGGPDKAVYAYPREHYDYWRAELPDAELPWGVFGENLTVEGLREDELNIGDRLGIGTAEFAVTQPRLPCYKLAFRFGRPDMVKWFLASRRTGFYLRVLREGEVGAGDAIELLSRDPGNVTVADITRLYAFEKDNRELLERAMNVAALPASWRDYFREKAADPAG